MDVLHLEYFCTVAQTKNISEAARRHFISQPAMSKQMAYIEKELQMPLFIRKGNQIKLSPEGEKFYIHAKRMVAEYQDALNFFEDSQKRMVINIEVSTTRHVLLRYLEEYLKEHPQVDVRVDFNLKQNLPVSFEISNNYHFVIGTSKNRNTDQNRFHPLFSERLMLAVPADHRLASRKSVSVCELKNELFVLQGSTGGYSKMLVNCCLENDFTPRIRVMTAETRYLLTLIAAGAGIGLVPEISWRDLMGDNIVLVEIEELRDHLLNHALYWNDKRLFPKTMVEFRKGLIEHYQRTAKGI